MIIVLVKYNCKPNCREAFLNALKENSIDTISKGEPGNFKYEYSYSTEDSDVLFLTEIWESAEALKLHGEAEHFKKLGGLKNAYVESAEIKKFEASSL